MIKDKDDYMIEEYIKPEIETGKSMNYRAYLLGGKIVSIIKRTIMVLSQT